MFEVEADSEDDFDGYFLQPVKGYNILERIREANNELFSTSQYNTKNIARKVTFKDVLEEYEPIQDKEDKLLDSCENEVFAHNSINHVKSDNINYNELLCIEILDSCDIEEICNEIIELKVDDEDKQDKETMDTNKESKEIKLIPVNSKLETLSELETINATEEVIFSIPENKKTDYNTNKEKSISKGLKSKEKTKISEINFKYKICCEYKKFIEDNLPQYNGYFSRYGLSKEQWEKRDKRYITRKKRIYDKNLKLQEEYNKKSNENEKAFINWLKKKMRLPTYKKNLFEDKKQNIKSKKIKQSVFRPL